MLALLLQRARAVLATAVLLSVPTFALWSLVGAGDAGNVGVARADDPIRNGLRIVDTPVVKPRTPQVTNSKDADEILLPTNWNFTDKGKPSPYG